MDVHKDRKSILNAFGTFNKERLCTDNRPGEGDDAVHADDDVRSRNLTEIMADDCNDLMANFRPIRRKSDIFDRLYNRSKKQVEVVEKDPEALVVIKKEWEKHRKQCKMNDKDARKYRMHEFIYEKKKQDKLKYHDSSK